MNVIKIGFIGFIMVINLVIAGCSTTPPTDLDVLNIIKSESVFARYTDTFNPTKITIKTSKIEGKKFTALLSLEFSFNTRSDKALGGWAREGQKDPIPYGYRPKPNNVIEVTGIFTKFDDGKWHLDGFTM